LAFSLWSSHTKIKFLNLRVNVDRNKTDLHRFKPNSCDVLINEQLNPLQLLHRKDTSNRHRGGKQECRYGRLILITLLSLWYLLFVDRIFYHSIYTVH